MAVSSRKRALWLGGFIAFGFTVFSLRLLELQVNRADYYKAVATEKHCSRQTIYARRGIITDVKGVVLASNEPVKTVVVDASVVKYLNESPSKLKKAAKKGAVVPVSGEDVIAKRVEVLAELLSRHLQMAPEHLKGLLAREIWDASESKMRPSPYIVIKREVQEQVVDGLFAEAKRLGVKGVFCEQDSVRVYPNGPMLCHVVGFVNRENKGVEGVERSMNDRLMGHDGFRYGEHDRTGKEMVAFRKLERPPRDGSTVKLTVDMALQDIVESELDAAVKQFRPKMITCIVMRPGTGEVLAMANRPHYDLSQREGVPDEARKNRAIMDMIEPGSTFKVVTSAAALDCKLVRPDTSIFCEHGRFMYGGTTLHDSHHGYGDLTVNDIVVKSSNIGVAKMGIMLGEQRLYEYIKRFNFGDYTGIQLPGEIRGIVHPPRNWSKISITHIPMGHEVGATPMQVINAMCTIANRGKMMTPQIISSITSASGEVLSSFPPVEMRQVVPAEVAEPLVSALKEVVSKKGTAPLAHVPGFEVAGKTGTAQKTSPGGGYEHGKYVVSFAGFLPADKPELCALVIMDEPIPGNVPYYGGYIAGPVFSKIAQRAARHLNLVPKPEFLKLSSTLADAKSGGRL
ncbi:MAG: penicillin-binding protein 2 [Verrucomicrobiota bacterium]